MWHSTRGIVFHTVRYSDTSVIAKIYTELFGIQSYLVRGIRKSGSKIKPALFQPLTLLQLEVNHRERVNLQSFREVHVAIPYQTIPFDMLKSSIALFLNELVYRSIREEEANAGLFEFLWSGCLALDSPEGENSAFHIFFAMDFMHYLGIYPQLNYSESTPVFDLREGCFRSGFPEHPDYLEGERSWEFAEVMGNGPHPRPLPKKGGGNGPRPQPLPKKGGGNGPHPRPLPKKGGGGRSLGWVLDVLMVYYRLHLPGFKGVESLKVLREVFGGG